MGRSSNTNRSTTQHLMGKRPLLINMPKFFSDDFAWACGEAKVSVVRRMICAGRDINSRNLKGWTGLIMAMSRKNIKIVRIMLAQSEIQLDRTNYYGITGLHEACLFNCVENVRLFLAHPTCTKDIVTMADKYGETAEMVAHKSGNQKCARLVREYLLKMDFIEQLEAEQRDLCLIESPLSNRKVDSILYKHLVGNDAYKKHRNEKQEQKLPHLQCSPGHSAKPPPPSSLIPSCPVCFENMKPPLRIFNCGNGHLICSVCKPKVTTNKCHCLSMYMGRATAMEQLVRQILCIM